MSGSAGRRVDLTAVNPLGINSNIINRGPDTSVLRPSIKTSVTGIRQVIHALEAGTKEIRNYLVNEVNIIYECKVCMNMFRSLANLTAHKRSYCLENFNDVNHVHSSKSGTEAANLQTVIIEAEPIETVIPEPSWDIENYSPSLELLKDAGIISAVEERPLVNRLLPPNKRSLNSVLSKLTNQLDHGQYCKETANKVDTDKEHTKTEGICLEPLKQSNNAQFQSWTTGFEYREVQQIIKAEDTIVIGPDGQEIPKGDMNGTLERSKSPTSSEGSKENQNEDFEDKNGNGSLDANSNTVRYPCPECKKGFSKVTNVYTHLAKLHGKSREEYTKLRKDITNNAYIVENNKLAFSGSVDSEDQDPTFHFKKTKKQEKSLQLALAVGLVNRNGVGMQKINKPPEKEETIDNDGPKVRGRPKKNPLDILMDENGQYDYEDSDNEISFNKDRIDDDGIPSKKRKTMDLVRENPKTGSWNKGDFICHDCEKCFKTATFLLQHYVSHYRHELREEFKDILSKRKCPTCGTVHESETKLMMHLGATHKEVIKFLPPSVTLFSHITMRNSPVKTKIKREESPAPIPCQKFLDLSQENIVSELPIEVEDKKMLSPKSGSPKSDSGSPKSPRGRPPKISPVLPEVNDEIMD